MHNKAKDIFPLPPHIRQNSLHPLPLLKSSLPAQIELSDSNTQTEKNYSYQFPCSILQKHSSFLRWFRILNMAIWAQFFCPTPLPSKMASSPPPLTEDMAILWFIKVSWKYLGTQKWFCLEFYPAPVLSNNLLRCNVFKCNLLRFIDWTWFQYQENSVPFHMKMYLLPLFEYCLKCCIK